MCEGRYIANKNTHPGDPILYSIYNSAIYLGRYRTVGILGATDSLGGRWTGRITDAERIGVDRTEFKILR